MDPGILQNSVSTSESFHPARALTEDIALVEAIRGNDYLWSVEEEQPYLRQHRLVTLRLGSLFQAQSQYFI
jgi:hypothetical protein